MKHEFDQYIDHYRKNLDQSLRLSGESSEYFAQLKAQKLKEWLSAFSKKRDFSVLDFGCGDGLMTSYVNKEFSHAKVYGVDPSLKSIQGACTSYPEINFFINSEQSATLPFEAHFFDIVYSAGTFHHIDFKMHAQYLDEIKRILKPGGFFVLFELNPLNPLTVYTFKNNPIDQNAHMLKPWYAYKMGGKWLKKKMIYYCFFPRFLSFLRPLEKYLARVPFSALYAVIYQK